MLILKEGGCFRKKRFPNANSMKDQHEYHVSSSKLKVIESNIQGWCSYILENHLDSMRDADLERQRIPKLSFTTEIK